jgi:hypothetical protein
MISHGEMAYRLREDVRKDPENSFHVIARLLKFPEIGNFDKKRWTAVSLVTEKQIYIRPVVKIIVITGDICIIDEVSAF